MPDKKDKKRDAPISIRVPRDALAEFTRRTEKSGLSRNAFVLKCVLDITPPPQHSASVHREKIAGQIARGGG